MLDHPITVVLNVFWLWIATGLKVSKFMGIQNQEEHIGNVKLLKVTDIRIVIFVSSIAFVHPYFPKSVNLTLTVVFEYSYVISSSCTFCINKSHQTKR